MSKHTIVTRYINDHGTIYKADGYYITRIIHGSACPFFRIPPTGRELPARWTRSELSAAELNIYTRQEQEREAAALALAEAKPKL